MADRTVASRVTRQRAARLRQGWHEVRVWVPTEDDAREIRELAERKRASAEWLHGLKEGVSNMDTTTAAAIIEAIRAQGSSAYSTPSGPVLTLLSDLAHRGDLHSFSNAFVIFARARPANAGYVEDSVPGKILNQFFHGRHKITLIEFERWRSKNPAWAERLKATVRDADLFARTVENMLGEMRAN